MKLLSHVQLSIPMDCSLLGSSIHGIFQARVLEWGAIAFSAHYIHRYAHMYSKQACDYIYMQYIMGL